MVMSQTAYGQHILRAVTSSRCYVLTNGGLYTETVAACAATVILLRLSQRANDTGHHALRHGSLIFIRAKLLSLLRIG